MAWAAASGAPDPAAGLDEALRSWLGAPPPAGGTLKIKVKFRIFPNGPWLSSRGE